MIETSDRRKARRFHVNCPVDYLAHDFLGNGLVVNASPYGVQIIGNYPPVVGVQVSLRMFLPVKKKPLYIERAVVRWRRDCEFGVEIMAMTSDARIGLNDFIDSLLREGGISLHPEYPAGNEPSH